MLRFKRRLKVVAWYLIHLDLIMWRISVDFMRDNIYFRLICLCMVGYYGGIHLGKFANTQFFLERVTKDVGVAEYLATVVVGIPVFILLWYFRTRDVRQQIEKTQAQLWQNHFNNAFENLISDSITQKEIGVKSLINLSKASLEFNELITIAFESTINEFQHNISKEGGIYYIYKKKKREYIVEVRVENTDSSTQFSSPHIEISEEEKFYLNNPSKESKFEYLPRKNIILLMQTWLSGYTKP